MLRSQGNEEIKSLEGQKRTGKTSTVFSPKPAKQIALAFVRYDYLAEGTELKANGVNAKVKNLPFIE